MQHRLGRDVAGLEQGGVAGPADADAAEQVGLGAAQLVEPRRAELQGAEDLGVGMEADGGAAAVMDRPGILQLRGRLAARVGLPPQHPVPRHLDLHRVGQRVHHRAADAVQAARRRIGLATELAARMQRGEDHLQRAEILELGMRIDRDAAAIVAHAEDVAGLQLHVDGGRMPGHRLVHGIVEDLGGQVVQRALVGAADIHAGAAADRLEPFQDLDVAGGVAVAGRRDRGQEIVHGVFPGLTSS